jgi:hypothetical protein
MSKNWLAVASADHVTVGRTEGFMQVCHGKVSPLQRLQPGDRVVYYSPTRRYSPSHALREKDRLQSFTALGTVAASVPYRADIDGERAEIFLPWRRDVAWHDAGEVALDGLKDRLTFTRAPNWGYRLRQGLVEISDEDMTLIAEAMFTAPISEPADKPVIAPVAEQPHRLAA